MLQTYVVKLDSSSIVSKASLCQRRRRRSDTGTFEACWIRERRARTLQRLAAGIAL